MEKRLDLFTFIRFNLKARKSKVRKVQRNVNVLLNGVDHKTVFLLGAGATRGAVKHVVVNRKRLKPPLNGDFFDVAATFARAHGTDSIEAKRLDGLNRFFKQDVPMKGKPSMETAFSLLYVVKDFHEIYRAGPGRKPLPGERQEIENFLLLVFHILGTVDDHAPKTNGYDRLVSKIGPKDTIITLNYDTLLDSALVRRGWNPKRAMVSVVALKKSIGNRHQVMTTRACPPFVCSSCMALLIGS